MAKSAERLALSSKAPASKFEYVNWAPHDPDLLVVGKGWWDHYQDKGLLGTDIAAALVVDEGTTGSSWKQPMTAQLTALDRREVAERVIARYNAELAQARAKIGDLLEGKSIAIAGADSGEIWLQNNTFAVSVAQDLGLNVLTDTAHAAPDRKDSTFYSLEELAIFDQADFVLLQNPGAVEAESPNKYRSCADVCPGIVQDSSDPASTGGVIHASKRNTPRTWRTPLICTSTAWSPA